MYQISFYVPTNCAENVKSAMFKAGAGKIKNYENCCWQTKGIGQFLAKDGAKPNIGEVGTLELVEEYKIEMICKDGDIDKVIKAMKKYHPYEEVAYFIIKLEEL